MPKIPGVSHRDAVRALKKAGFLVAREGRKHTVMSDGHRIVTVPRHNPINGYTMAGIVEAAGLDIQTFKELL